MRKNKKRNINEEINISRKAMLVSCLVATALFYVASVIVILLSSLFAYKSKISFELMPIIAKTALVLPSLLCGLLISVKNRTRQISSSITLGSLIVLTLFLISLFSGHSYTLSTLIWFAVTLVSTTLGGIIGIYITENRPKRRKHR